MPDDENATEVSIASAYCVVYELIDSEWKVAGEGWSQVHLYKDKNDGSQRIVGWTVLDLVVVINCNVTSTCKYKKKSDDFHKFTDEEGTVWGFGFYKKEESFAESENFMKMVKAAILPLRQASKASKASKVSKAGKEQESGDGREKVMGAPEHGDNLYRNEMIPLGKLAIQPPKTGRDESKQPPAVPKGKKGKSITDPYGIVHTQHVKYDKNTKTYQGLPPEWQSVLNKQFGVDPKDLDSVDCGYKSKIPQVLVRMKDYLFEHGGLEMEGVFRIAPDAEEGAYVKQQMNENKFESCDDVHVISNLIKVWYRDLPDPVLDGVNEAAVKECETAEDAKAIMATIPEPKLSLFLFLLDMCSTVSAQSKINKMSEQNLGIVIGPNLFTPSAVDPMASLLYSQKVAAFMRRAIQSRAKS
jgi:hypothetical protein